MKLRDKFSDNILIMVPRRNKRGNHRHFITRGVIFASLLFSALTVHTLADTTSYTIDTVAEGLLKAEAHLTDLQLHYSIITEGRNAPNSPIQILDGIYAEKKAAKRLRYLDYQDFTVDPNTQQRLLVRSTISSFNGETTAILYRHPKTEPDKMMKGYIVSGYESGHFPTSDRDPHTMIWYYAGKLLGDIIKEHKETFHIENNSEMLNGIPVVRLVGTISDGKLTVKLWVSPDRNFLPMKQQIVRTDNGKLLSEKALYDLVQLPNGMWYPKTIKSPADPPGAPNPAYLMTCNISKISIEPIPETLFSPEFPPNTRVIDDVLKASYTTY